MMRKLLWGFPLSVLALAGGVVSLFAWNLYSFERLTDEVPIARLRFVQIAPQRFQAELRTGDFCQARTFELLGDEWRIDARFLKWKPWANLFGLDARYRLERLSGRYQDVVEQNTRAHHAYRISETPALDVIDYVRRDWGSWSPLDTSFGSSVYERIEPEFEYIVYRSQSGLLVRKRSLAPARYEDGALVIHIDKDC